MKNIFAASLLFCVFPAFANIAGLFVDGNTISWTESGWMQVQEQSNYSTLCEGEIQSCTVPAGTYQVINHSTGANQQNVRVGDQSTTGNSGTGSGNLLYITNTCSGLLNRPPFLQPNCQADCPPQSAPVGVLACSAFYRDRPGPREFVPAYPVLRQIANQPRGVDCQMNLQAADSNREIEVETAIACMTMQ